jgi:hypothetical protein
VYFKVVLPKMKFQQLNSIVRYNTKHKTFEYCVWLDLIPGDMIECRGDNFCDPFTGSPVRYFVHNAQALVLGVSLEKSYNGLDVTRIWLLTDRDIVYVKRNGTSSRANTPR